MKLQLDLTGVRPMIVHNARMANPLDEYTRKLASLTGKQKKTTEDIAEIAMWESRGSAYETPEGLVGLPVQNLWRSIYDASKKYKLGEDVKRALLIEDTTEPMLIDGKTIPVDEYLQVDGHVDYSSVVVQRKRVMRSRPIFAPGWQCTMTMELLDDELELHKLVPAFERAGRLVGLCERRPMYGTYQLTWKEIG